LAPVRGDAVELDRRQRVDRPGERPDRGVVARVEADAVKARVDLDLHPHLDPGGDGGRGQPAGLVLAVDVHGQTRAGRDPGQTGPLVLADGRIGDHDVLAPGSGEHLRLGRLGRRDAACPGGQLLRGDLRRLVRLYVRAQGHAVPVGHRLPRGDVRLHPVEIDDQRRRGHLREGHARLDVDRPHFHAHAVEPTPSPRPRPAVRRTAAPEPTAATPTTAENTYPASTSPIELSTRPNAITGTTRPM